MNPLKDVAYSQASGEHIKYISNENRCVGELLSSIMSNLFQDSSGSVESAYNVTTGI